MAVLTVAVVLRFGRLVGDTREEQVHQPGLLLAFPYVIDEVVKVPVGRIPSSTSKGGVSVVMIITVFSSTEFSRAASLRKNSYTDPTYADIESTGYLITGDENILHVDATVKYKITDPVEYARTTAASLLFTTRMPEQAMATARMAMSHLQ